MCVKSLKIGGDMQVSAVGSNLNNISFSSNSRYEHRPYQDYDNYDEYDEYIEGDSVEFGSQRISDDEMNELMLASKNVSDTAHKASQDVSPVTVVASLVAAVGTIAAVKGKAMPYVRAGAATAMEVLTKMSARAFEGARVAVITVANKFKKADVNSINKAKEAAKGFTQKVDNKVYDFAEKIRSDVTKGNIRNDNVMNMIETWSAKVVGEDKAKVLVDAMDKQKINNVGRMFDFTVGLVAAWKFADCTSDVVEGGIDDAKIQSAVGQLKSLAGSLGLDFTDDQITSLINKKLSHDKAA